MHNFNGTYFCKKTTWENCKTVFNQMNYKKTANRVGILATSRLVCCEHKLHRFRRGDCS